MSGETPLISVIMPVYNVTAYVEDAMRSVFRQTYTGIEFLIVDDCGTDDSMAKVARLLTEAPQSMTVKVLHHDRNKGLSEARNTGLKAASGAYIFFLDSDDLLFPDTLAYLQDVAGKSGCEAVVGSSLRFADMEDLARKKESVSAVGEPELKVWMNRDQVLLAFARDQWPMSGWNKLIRRDVLLKNQLFFIPGLLHEDGIWNFQTAFHFSSLAYSPRVTYAYRVNPGSITSVFTKRNVDSFGIIIGKYFEGLQLLPRPLQKQMLNWYESNRHNMTNHAAMVLTKEEWGNWFTASRCYNFSLADWLGAPMNLKTRFWSLLYYVPEFAGTIVYRQNAQRLLRRKALQ